MTSVRTIENRLAKQRAIKADIELATIPQNIKDELSAITKTTFEGVMNDSLSVSQLTPWWITRDYVKSYSIIGLTEYVRQEIQKLHNSI